MHADKDISATDVHFVCDNPRFHNDESAYSVKINGNRQDFVGYFKMKVIPTTKFATVRKQPAPMRYTKLLINP